MKRVVTLILVTLICACAALAQVPFQQASIVDSSAGYLMLPAVQKELGLSPAVSKKIQDKMAAATRTMSAPSANASKTQDRNKQMEEFSKRMQTMLKTQRECIALLDSGQKSRLKQIAIQQLGASAMFNPEVKTDLGLTPAQSTKISEIVQKGYRDVFAQPAKSTGARPTQEEQMKQMQDYMKKQQALQVKLNAEATKVLTPAQRTKWKAMQGKPFKIDTSGMFRSMMGGGRAGK